MTARLLDRILVFLHAVDPTPTRSETPTAREDWCERVQRFAVLRRAGFRDDLAAVLADGGAPLAELLPWDRLLPVETDGAE